MRILVFTIKVKVKSIHWELNCFPRSRNVTHMLLIGDSPPKVTDDQKLCTVPIPRLSWMRSTILAGEIVTGTNCRVPTLQQNPVHWPTQRTADVHAQAHQACCPDRTTDKHAQAHSACCRDRAAACFWHTACLYWCPGREAPIGKQICTRSTHN